MEMEISLRSLSSIARAQTHLSTTRTNVSHFADPKAAFCPRRRMHISDLWNSVATGCKRVQPYTVAPVYATATLIDPIPGSPGRARPSPPPPPPPPPPSPPPAPQDQGRRRTRAKKLIKILGARHGHGTDTGHTTALAQICDGVTPNIVL